MNTQLSRRDFLRISGLLAAWTALSACQPHLPGLTGGSSTAAPTPNPPNPSTSTTASPAPIINSSDLLTHALRRLTFGATPAMVQHAQALGLDAWLDEQLHPETLDDSATEGRLANLTTLTMTPAQRNQLDRRGLPAQELVLATLIRQRFSSRQVYEMLVDFWSNHFNIYIAKSLCRVLKTDDDLQAIRPNALGKFEALLSASAHSPAMLVYLDNAESTQDVPNENYARELMELHTLSVNGGYSQFDVTALARALTGWSIAAPRDAKRGLAFGTYLYRPFIHDNGDKRILDLGLPAGGGEQDGVQALAYLAHHDQTAHFISTKLARRFVADDPPASLVDQLALVFKNTEGDTRELLKAIVHSNEFAAAVGAKVKRPLEFFISALRLTEAEVTGTSRGLAPQLKTLGQIPFGWQTPDGYPDYAGWWVTTSSLLNRWNFGLQLTANLIPGVRVDLKALTQDAASPADVVDVLSRRFLGEVLPADARAIVLEVASAGDLGHNLPAIAGLILGSPHFQVR